MICVCSRTCSTLPLCALLLLIGLFLKVFFYSYSLDYLQKLKKKVISRVQSAFTSDIRDKNAQFFLVFKYFYILYYGCLI